MYMALKATRQGYYAWKKQPLCIEPHAVHDEKLVILVLQVRSRVRDIYDASKVLFKLRQVTQGLIKCNFKAVADVIGKFLG